MKMVSAAKLRRAQDAIVQMRPYANKLQEMLSNIVSNEDGGGAGMSLAEERPVQKVLFIVITSDRGLCGAYNANIQKMALATINEKYKGLLDAGGVTIWAIGKKGAEFFQKKGFNVNTNFRDTFLQLSFAKVQECAKAAIEVSGLKVTLVMLSPPPSRLGRLMFCSMLRSILHLRSCGAANRQIDCG